MQSVLQPAPTVAKLPMSAMALPTTRFARFVILKFDLFA
jgi:hypothetical protein